MSALDRWRSQLDARAIPPEILKGAPEPPWGFPAELFRARADAALSTAETPTTRRARERLPVKGTALDIGVGGGATSLPLADRAGTIIGVDSQPDMLRVFSGAAEPTGVETVAIRGTWPDVADRTLAADVVVCGHVVYNVADLRPFVSALSDHARFRVVVELTQRHPVAWMNDLWERFHGVRFPDGPTAEDAQAALGEMGIRPDIEKRRDEAGARGGGFARREDAVHLVRRRLCLPAERDPEIVEALGIRLRERNGHWSAGGDDQVVVTLHWDTDGFGG